MRFIVDAQLPPALARSLSEKGHVAEHVGDIGLMTAADSAIWQFARQCGAVIITKDEDFPVQRLGGRHRSQVVWVRVGNCSRAELLRRFDSLMPEIEALLIAGEAVIEGALRPLTASS